MLGRSHYTRYLNSKEFKQMPVGARLEMFRQVDSAREIERAARYDARLARLRYKLNKRDLQTKIRLRSRELRVRSIETYFRTGIAGVLVAVLAVALFVGIVKGIPAIELAEYVSPISGLAGIAIGYFFGRAADKADAATNEDNQSLESSEVPGGDRTLLHRENPHAAS